MKRIIYFVLVFAIICTMLLMMSGCSSNSDVVGVWKFCTKEFRENADIVEGTYLYLYSDNTADHYYCNNYYGWQHEGNYTWKIKGKYILIDPGYGNSWKLTYDNQYFYNAQGKVSFEKVSNDSTVDLY